MGFVEPIDYSNKLVCIIQLPRSHTRFSKNPFTLIFHIRTTLDDQLHKSSRKVLTIADMSTVYFDSDSLGHLGRPVRSVRKVLFNPETVFIMERCNCKVYDNIVFTRRSTLHYATVLDIGRFQAQFVKTSFQKGNDNGLKLQYLTS